MDVLLAAAKRDGVVEVLSLARAAGFLIEAVEPTPLALKLKSDFDADAIGDSEKPCLVLDIGINSAADAGTDMVVDYDHQSVFGVKDGVGGTAMPAWREAFSDEEIWNLVNYLRTFENVATE